MRWGRMGLLIAAVIASGSPAWAQFIMPGEQAHKGSVTTNRLRGNRDSLAASPTGPRMRAVATDALDVNNASFPYPSGMSATATGVIPFLGIRHSPTISGIDVGNPVLTFISAAPIWQYTTQQTFLLKSGMTFSPTLQSSGSIGSGAEGANLALIALFMQPKFDGTVGPRTIPNLRGAQVQTNCAGGTCTQVTGFQADLVSVSGATLTTGTGLLVTDGGTAASTVGTSIGVDVNLSATVSTASISFRSQNSQSDMLHAGSADFGSTTAHNGMLNVTGHFHTLGTAPTVTAGGCTSNTITTESTDTVGEVTLSGTCTAVTTITLTFNLAWTNRPICHAFFTSVNGLATNHAKTTDASASNTMVLTFASAVTSGDKVGWHCLGME